MEEEKAAALYDELTRKGEGAARFKQGLGFSAASNKDAAVPSRSSALPTFSSSSSSSSFLSTFVKASSPSKTAELEKQARLESIQNKLKKEQPRESQTLTTSAERDSSYSSFRSREKDRHSRRRSRSRDRDRHSRRRSRSRSRDDYRRRRGYRSRSRSREREREGDRRRRKSRGESPRKREEDSSNLEVKGRNSSVNYAELIEGYEKMTAAEKVKAKMKHQLSETAAKDEKMGMGTGWERFEFDKDAALDDEEIEAAEDDAALVKHIGQSFRFTTVEARRDEEIKAAHDEAMFGAYSHPPATETDEEDPVNIEKKTHESAAVTNLLSNQVLTMQQGSWRDRARKL